MSIKRPMVWLLASYIIGMASYKAAWEQAFIALLLMGIFITLWICHLWKVKKDSVIQNMFLLGLPILFLSGYIQLNRQMASPPMDSMFQEEVHGMVQGKLEMISEKESYTELTLINNNITIPSVSKQTFLSNRIVVYSSKNTSYKIGNILLISGKIIKFNKATNPGQFDEYQYKRIGWTDYKMKADEIQVINPSCSWFNDRIYSMKLKLTGVFQSILKEKDAGIIIAMMLGDMTFLDSEIKELYQKNGISHILAISGLHISLIGLSLYKFLSKIKIPKLLTTIISLGFIFTYGVMTNFSVSTNRAVVMLMILMIAGVIGRTYDIITAIALSALIILIQSPMHIFHAGFLLSFSAMLGIALLYPVFRGFFSFKNNIWNGLMMSLSIQCMTLPIILYYFYEVPVYSLLVNLIILPLSSFLILLAIPAGLLGCFSLPLGRFLMGSPHYILYFYETVCKIAVRLPGNTYVTGRPGLFVIVTYYAIIITFLLLNSGNGHRFHKPKSFGQKMVNNKKIPADHENKRIAAGHENKRIPEDHENKRIASVYGNKSILILLFLLIILIKPHNFNLKVTFLDVGQGDGIYMQMPDGKTYFIDGGSMNIKNVGKYRMEPFLKSQGIRQLDYAVVTHFDMDHISGLIEILSDRSIKIKNILLPDIINDSQVSSKLLSLAQSAGTQIAYMKKGQVRKEGDVKISCLHPQENETYETSNGGSLVLEIQYDQFDMLLTGDLEGDGENALNKLLGSRGDGKSYDILKVAHHGSKYATGTEFLHNTKPKIAVISYGKGNKYGHPHFEVLERLEKQRSTILTTADQGAISIETNGKEYILKCYCY